MNISKFKLTFSSTARHLKQHTRSTTEQTFHFSNMNTQDFVSSGTHTSRLVDIHTFAGALYVYNLEAKTAHKSTSKHVFKGCKKNS
jgi:hypothetical protein